MFAAITMVHILLGLLGLGALYVAYLFVISIPALLSAAWDEYGWLITAVGVIACVIVLLRTIGVEWS